MKQLPEEIIAAWENHDGPAVLTTVSPDGMPNTIYVTCVRRYEDGTFLVADNKFHKTRENLSAPGNCSLLFITAENKACQLKGTVRYETDGARREFMRECLDPKYPVHAVAVLTVEEAYSGAEKLL